MLRLNNVKTRTAMNVKVSLFVIYVEAIIYFLLYNLQDCTFKALAITNPYNRYIGKYLIMFFIRS